MINQNTLPALVCLVSIAILTVSLPAMGHGRWIVPSHTVLSGEDSEAITFDASISNDVFFPDYAFGGPMNIEIHDDLPEPLRKKLIAEKTWNENVRCILTLPDGFTKIPLPLINLTRKTVTQTTLSKEGTYKVQLIPPSVNFADFKDGQGNGSRRFGSMPGKRELLPKEATNIKWVTHISLVQTYITKGNVSITALEIEKKGLDLKWRSHPSDLIHNEVAEFTLVFEGSPLADASVSLTPAGTRHRNSRNTLNLQSSPEGSLSVNWPDPGYYLLECTYEVPDSEIQDHFFQYNLFVTLEVFPV